MHNDTGADDPVITNDETALPITAALTLEADNGAAIEATDSLNSDRVIITIFEGETDEGRAITLTKADARRFAAFLAA